MKPLRENGGHAFPCPGSEHGWIDGMTLRDWFAGRALSGIVGKACFDQPTQDMIHNTGVQTKDFEAYFAHLSYRMADAMLKERSK